MENTTTIKVHVTWRQRNLLEYHVNRRVYELQHHTYGNCGPKDYPDSTELQELLLLQTELSQAGT